MKNCHSNKIKPKQTIKKKDRPKKGTAFISLARILGFLFSFSSSFLSSSPSNLDYRRTLGELVLVFLFEDVEGRGPAFAGEPGGPRELGHGLVLVAHGVDQPRRPRRLGGEHADVDQLPDLLRRELAVGGEALVGLRELLRPGALLIALVAYVSSLVVAEALARRRGERVDARRELMGLAGASLMQTVNISTTNFQTFAELAFQFKLTPGIVVQTLVFALAMGFVGGFIPAWRAARLQIVDCLRAA